MKKALAVVLMILANVAVAEDWTNPEAKFDARKVMTDTSNINWRRVENVQQVCESESKKRGMGGFGYSVYACSFWDKNSCTIITSVKPTLHDLGHEMRHCFQGNYH